MWQPVLRAASKSHNLGHAAAAQRNIEGPYNVTGVSETPSARAAVRLHADGGREEAACADEILVERWPAAPTGVPSRGRHQGADRVLQ